jgi:hypothetical protein
MDCKKYIGMDVDQATISVAVMDEAGKVVMDSVMETKARTILEFIQPALDGEDRSETNREGGKRMGPSQGICRRRVLAGCFRLSANKSWRASRCNGRK